MSPRAPSGGMGPRAVVVGAGLGGLAAGVALQRAGYEPRLFERRRAPAPGVVGTGPPPLILAPNGARALAELGALDDVLPFAARIETVELRDAWGRALNRFPLARVEQRAGAPALCIEATALRDALLARLGAGVAIEKGNAEGFSLDSLGATLRLDDGRAQTGALLVGADGARSAVRELVHGADTARMEPAIAWRGAATLPPSSDLPPGLLVQYEGDGGEAGMVRLSDERVYWYATARDGAQDAAAPVRDPRFHRLVEATERGAMRREVVFDAEPLSRWGEGRLTLLGDAAHPMLPTTVQGAAQALEDAVVLGRCLAEVPDDGVAAALRRYEELRMPRTAAVARLARRGGAWGLAHGRVTTKLRDTAIRMVPGRVFEGRLGSLVDWDP